MKKVLLIAALAFVGYKLFAHKSNDAALPVNDYLPGDFNHAPTSNLEGHIVVDPAGNWYIVHDGQLYYPQGLKALQDYQAAFPDFAAQVNITDAEFQSMPISGTLLEGLVFSEKI